MSETESSASIGFHSDKQSTIDEFGRKPFAYRVADVLVHQPLGDCLVVGISGEWGSGKSTTLAYVKERLAQVPCKLLEFNPWRFPGEDKLLFELFDKLVKAIDPDGNILTTWQRATAGAERAFEPAIATGSFASDFAIPGTGNLLRSAGNFFRSYLLTSIEEVKKQAIAFLEKENVRVIVLMDDLDRLETADLMALLRIIKLVADLPNTSFVLAMDEDHVARTVGERIGGGITNGRLYLEKIIQVRLTLPAIPWSRMHKYSLGLIQQVLSEAGVILDSEEKSRFREIFDDIFALQIRTPRSAKAWANATRFSLGILPNEVNTVDLVLLECARLTMPKLYMHIRTDIAESMTDKFLVTRQILGEQSTLDPIINKLMSCFGETPSEEIAHKRRVMLRWFPNLQREHWYSGPKDWEKNRRLCSKEYFWRFFSSTISSDDMRDAEVSALIVQATNTENDLDNLIANIKEQLQKESHTAFLRKVAVFGSIAPKAIKPLTLALSQISYDKDSADTDLSNGLAAESARACASLIETIKEKEPRLAIEAECISAATDLMWAYEVRRRLRSNGENEQAKDNDGNQCPATVLADKALQRIEDNCPVDHQLFSRCLWTVWHDGDRSRLKMALKIVLEKRPHLALNLLTSVCSRRTSPVPRPPERCFEWQKDSLSSLEKVVELEALTHALNTLSISTTSDSRQDSEIIANQDLCTPEELIECYFASVQARERSASQDVEVQPNA